MRIRLPHVYPLIFLCLSLVVFSPGIQELIDLFSRIEFRENLVGFLCISGYYGLIVWRHRVRTFQTSVHPFLAILFIGTVILFYLNHFLFSFDVLGPSLTILGLFAVSGMGIPFSTWKKLLPIAGLLILMLPMLERLQKYGSFPLRLFTAHSVSVLLGLVGLGNVSKEGIIITENAVSSVDLPCSGITSVYTGTIIFLAISLLERLRMTVKLGILFIVFVVALIVMNIWRVFSLVVIVDLYRAGAMGNTIHIGLGITGFLLVIMGLIYALKKGGFARYQHHVSEGWTGSGVSIRTITFILFLFIGFPFMPLRESPPQPQVTYAISVPETELTSLPLTQSEKRYFETNEVSYLQKYRGITASQKQFSLLVVGSTSARSHHDPETCLQGLGYTIQADETIEIEGQRMRRIRLNSDDYAYYWFVGKEKTVTGYSERVWEEWNDKHSAWTLVLIGMKRERGEDIFSRSFIEAMTQEARHINALIVTTR